MSTMMPRRFSSRTTSLPKSVRPLCFGVSPDESLQLVLTLCDSVR